VGNPVTTVPRAITAVRAVKVRPDRHVELPEHVVTEEPMQVLIAGPGQEPMPLAITMRTPGHDFELAAGFTVTEGVCQRQAITSVTYCDAPDLDPPDPNESGRFNTVTVGLAHPWQPPQQPRHFVASASCGVCGKTTLDQLETSCQAVAAGGVQVPASVITGLPDALRDAQPVFERTGGLHAAGLFSYDGRLLCAREDVGRHNAVDKVVGYTVLGRLPAHELASSVLMVSGRVSFEITQKAALAGIGTIAAVSAPSSLAVSAAARLGVALIAFVRGKSFNIYSHPERIALEQ
jgi:FdhD protein